LAVAAAAPDGARNGGCDERCYRSLYTLLSSLNLCDEGSSAAAVPKCSQLSKNKESASGVCGEDETETAIWSNSVNTGVPSSGPCAQSLNGKRDESEAPRERNAVPSEGGVDLDRYAKGGGELHIDCLTEISQNAR
jgi:hypothetical protein